MMRRRSVWVSLGLIALTIALGLTLRMAPLGLPRFVVKYGGSTMWALMIYWLFTTMLPGMRLPAAVVSAGVVATAVECFKLYRSPAVDAFRETLAGTLILGRYFSVADLIAYWLAIAAGMLIDRRIRN